MPVLLTVVLVLTGCTSSPPEVDYAFDVRPILSENCFACHGPDDEAREADFRLDLPGELPEDELIRRIHASDPDEVMPPPESKLKLTEEQKQVIEQWIDAGAEYKPHWAFSPPEAVDPPDVAAQDWIRNPIDRFVQARLEAEGLSPAPEADKATLLRRASFDLTGLPPTLAEIDAFLADTSADAYETVVDRLLASPAYGERMAYHWLDVARYADSDGYLDDKHRDFTPWRDWVIRAFNTNLPYNRFVTWQLAGDLLPNATQEQILATAFNRLHKKNSEAGIVFEEFRVEYVADRTNTLGKAFLGLTLECARCHDHKFDPISQKDYYQFFAFFNSTQELGTAVYGPGQTPGPALLLTDEEAETQIDFLKAEQDRREQKLEQQTQAIEFDVAAWARETDVIAEVKHRMEHDVAAYYPFDEITYTSDDQATTPDRVDPDRLATLDEPVIAPGVQGDAFFVSDYNGAVLGENVGWYGRTESFSIDLWVYPDTVYADAAVLLHTEELRLGLKGYSLYLEQNRLKFIMAHSWPHNALQVKTRTALPPKTWAHVTLTYDGSSKASGVRLFIDEHPAELDIEYDNLYRTILFEPNIHTYGFKGIQLGQRDKFKPLKKGGIDEIRVFDRALTSLEVFYLHRPRDVEAAVHYPTEEAHPDLLREYYLAYHAPDLDAPRQRLKAVRDSLNALVSDLDELMVMGDLPEPRPTYVLERGMYDRHGEPVAPGAPESVLSFPDHLPPSRLGLAQWLFHPDNPLTARVMVNRMWQLHFGRGLVETSDDFGNQGSLPSHPELLDWLATEFRVSGWDLKALHRLIVTSATYRQSSVIPPDLLQRDPDNVLLARGPRFRLPAEMIRDNALAISGLLVEQTGGESVYPYQPEGLWDEITNKSWRYPYLQEPGEGLYRRSLYTIWKRTSPPPSLLIFDAPDRAECTVRREATSTPLQALVLLNDPQFVEAARVLAENLTRTAGDDLDHRLNQSFRLVTGRRPDAREMSVLQNFYQQQLEAFTQSPDDAAAYLNTGEHPHTSGLPVAETAALAVVINGIMNTDEGYTKK